ncbi:MAG: terminase family protein [Methanobacterium sp.]
MAENYIIDEVYECQGEIITCPDRFIEAHTGRQFGKTGGDVRIARNTAITVPGSKICFVGLSYNSVRDTAVAQFDACTPSAYLNKRNCRDSAPIRRAFKNGSFVDFFGGGSPDKLRGPNWNKIIIDEAQDQKPELWYKVCRPMLMVTQGSAIITYTTKGKFNWTTDLTTDPNFTHFHFSTLQGGRVTAEEIENLRNEMDPLIFRQEILGEIIDFSGGAYYNYGEKCHTDVTYLPYADTIITFDFNVSPCTCTMLQRYDYHKWAAVKEFTLYNSNTYNLCNAINNYLSINKFTGNLQARGDFEGNKRSSNSTTTDWLIIKDAFKMYRNFSYKIQKCVNTRNRIDALNTALFDGTIKINKKECPYLDKDLTISCFKEGTNELDSHGGKENHWSDNLSYFAWIDYPITNKFKTLTKAA